MSFKIRTDESGNGQFTIDSTDVLSINTNTTVSLPTGTANGVLYLNGSKQVTSGSGLMLDSSGNLQFNSGYGSAATAYACRAWVNFNGTGTVAIRASGNVSSITDNGVGKFGINFTNAMPDANYSIVGTQNYSDDNADTALNIVAQIRRITTPLTTTVANVMTSYNQNLQDPTIACFSVFR